MFFKQTKTRDKVERHNIYIKKKAFTLSEVLIALTVIGIIAAMTISVLNSNIREAEVEAKLKKAVSVLNGAMYRASIDHGAPSTWGGFSENGMQIESFANKYLIPYLITLRPMQNVSLRSIGYKDVIKTPSGKAYASDTLDDTFPRIFLNDGTIIVRLTLDINEAEYIYKVDINGPKGPNVIGRDVFNISVFGKTDNPYVAMYGFYDIDEEGNVILKNANELVNACEKTGAYCGAIIQANSWKIPDNYPLKI